MLARNALFIPMLAICPVVQANVIVASSLTMTGLQIVPETGTMEILSGFGVSAFASAIDSLVGFDQNNNAVVDTSTTVIAETSLANAGAAAAAPTLTAGAGGGVSISGIDAFANTGANGQLSGTFEIADNSGTETPVSVLFSAALSANQSLMTDSLGISANSEVIFQLSLPDLRLVPFLFYDSPLTIGPSQFLTGPAVPTLSATTTLMTNMPYALFVETDAEASGQNAAAPEPSALLLASAGLVAVALGSLRRRS